MSNRYDAHKELQNYDENEVQGGFVINAKEALPPRIIAFSDCVCTFCRSDFIK